MIDVFLPNTTSTPKDQWNLAKPNHSAPRLHVAGHIIGHQSLETHPVQQIGGLLPTSHLEETAASTFDKLFQTRSNMVKPECINGVLTHLLVLVLVVVVVIVAAAAVVVEHQPIWTSSTAPTPHLATQRDALAEALGGLPVGLWNSEMSGMNRPCGSIYYPKQSGELYMFVFIYVLSWHTDAQLHVNVHDMNVQYMMHADHCMLIIHLHSHLLGLSVSSASSIIWEGVQAPHPAAKNRPTSNQLPPAVPPRDPIGPIRSLSSLPLLRGDTASLHSWLHRLAAKTPQVGPNDSHGCRHSESWLWPVPNNAKKQVWAFTGSCSVIERTQFKLWQWAQFHLSNFSLSGATASWIFFADVHSAYPIPITGYKMIPVSKLRFQFIFLSPPKRQQHFVWEKYVTSASSLPLTHLTQEKFDSVHWGAFAPSSSRWLQQIPVGKINELECNPRVDTRWMLTANLYIRIWTKNILKPPISTSEFQQWHPNVIQGLRGFSEAPKVGFHSASSECWWQLGPGL